VARPAAGGDPADSLRPQRRRASAADRLASAATDHPRRSRVGLARSDRRAGPQADGGRRMGTAHRGHSARAANSSRDRGAQRRKTMTLAIPMVDIPVSQRRLGSLSTTGKAPLPLEGVSLKARVIDRVAEVVVEQKFQNPFTEAIEAVYVGGEELPREQAGHGVVPDSTTVPDASRITPPRLVPGFDPRVALNIEAELFGALKDLECSQHAVRSSSGPESARVQLSREREPLDRDFVLRWSLAAEKVQSQLLVHGGFGMLSLIPPAREGFLGTPRDVVFVVDRSGSMQGPKMASAARACALLLRTLGPRDRFAALAFDDIVEWMPGGFAQADEGGLERGEKWLCSVFARGGT